MRQHYPTFRSPELSSLVGQLKDFECQVDEGQETLNRLRASRDSTDEELRNQTYEWLVHYELRVEFDNHGRYKPWLQSFDMSDWKYYSGEYVETGGEAREKVMNAKREIASFPGQKVMIGSHGRNGELREVTVVDHNVYWVRIVKGRFNGRDRSNIIFEEKRPDHQPKGWDD